MIGIRIATLVRRALAEVCTVPVLLVTIINTIVTNCHAKAIVKIGANLQCRSLCCSILTHLVGNIMR